MIRMSMKSEKINFKISSDISSWRLRKSVTMSKWSWLQKLIGGEKTVISTAEIGLSYKSFFVLGMLHTLRSHNSKEILAGMVKMLASKTVEVVEDPQPEPEVDDKRGPEVVAELVSLQEQIFSRSTEVVELPIETVDIPAEPIMELAPFLAVMRASIFLRSTAVHNPLQIFLQETGS